MFSYTVCERNVNNVTMIETMIEVSYVLRRKSETWIFQPDLYKKAIIFNPVTLTITLNNFIYRTRIRRVIWRSCSVARVNHHIDLYYNILNDFLLCQATTPNARVPELQIFTLDHYAKHSNLNQFYKSFLDVSIRTWYTRKLHYKKNWNISNIIKNIFFGSKSIICFFR